MVADNTTTNPKHRLPPSNYSPAEEAANIATHAFGILLSAVGLVVLIVTAVEYGDALQIVAVSVFGTSLLLLYIMSTLYHTARSPRLKHALRVCDHVAIYFLIAGTYTPFTLVMLRGAWGWTLFGVTWGIALAGLILKVFFMRRFHLLGVLSYLAMGWMVLVAVKPVMQVLPTGALAWLVAGGLMYTIGVVFYLLRHMPYHHAVWHLFVLSGSTCHFMAVLWYVRPVIT